MKIFTNSKNLLYFSWAIVLVGVLGSLYFSEVSHFTPCPLCWYQRIFLYPLLFIIPVGILRNDRGVGYYALPLSILGTIFAGYHELLQLGIIKEALEFCTSGVSCTSKYIDWFGFVSIPLLSFLAFLTVTILLYISHRNIKNKLTLPYE